MAATVSSDDGYFPRGKSVLRQVQEERAVGLVFGQRALMLGALMHPLAYYGTSAHTNAKERPFQRLVHTAKAFEAIFFGTREEADRVLAYVHKLHSRVKGTLAEDLGPWPAGTPYSAFDPEEMFWGVVATTFDAAFTCYETLVRPLTADEGEAMWRDYVRFGELFGMPREAAPTTYREFRAAWDERLHSKWAFLSEEAREVGYITGYEIPAPPQNRPGMRVIEQLLTGMMPPRARELYGLRFGRGDEVAFRALARASRASRPLTPNRIRRGSCDYFYDLVAKTERRRIERGEPTPQVASAH
jgi:uncharacterized protein (DUF2236 family)